MSEWYQPAKYIPIQAETAANLATDLYFKGISNHPTFERDKANVIEEYGTSASQYFPKEEEMPIEVLERRPKLHERDMSTAIPGRSPVVIYER